MKMIIGLGNPGPKYKGTKHNVGFETMDELADRHQFSINKNLFDAFYAEVFINNEKTLFVKPMSYMNNSGKAVRPLTDYFGVEDEDILIIYDDLDLDVGQVRFRLKGSPGGHNGMKDIVNVMGTRDLKRARIGIGRPHPKQSVVSYVLGGFKEEEKEIIQESIQHTADAVDFWLEGHTFEALMSQYNK